MEWWQSVWWLLVRKEIEKSDGKDKKEMEKIKKEKNIEVEKKTEQRKITPTAAIYTEANVSV